MERSKVAIISMTHNENNRNYGIEFLQCIGIMLVVSGHVGGIDILTEWFPVYSYHMPLWFFISGLLYKTKQETSYGKSIRHKIYKFFGTYFLWNAVY